MTQSRRGQAAKHAGYGMGSANTDRSSLRLADPDAVLAEVEARFTDPDYMPPVRPEVAEVLARLATMPGVSREDVAALFEADPLLAGRLIRVATEAGSRPIRTFKELWSGTGTIAIHRIIVRVHRKTRILRNDDYARVLGQVASHSAATARLARLVARSTPFPEDHAWFCGVVHDAGLAAGLSVLSDVPGGDAPELDQALLVLDEVHDRCSWTLSRLWMLPPDVRLVVASHHNPFRSGTVHPVAALICIADALAASFGYPAWTSSGLSQRADNSGAARLSACRAELGITDSAWTRIQASAEQEMARLG